MLSKYQSVWFFNCQDALFKEAAYISSDNSQMCFAVRRKQSLPRYVHWQKGNGNNRCNHGHDVNVSYVLRMKSIIYQYSLDNVTKVCIPVNRQRCWNWISDKIISTLMDDNSIYRIRQGFTQLISYVRMLLGLMIESFSSMYFITLAINTIYGIVVTVFILIYSML